MKINKNNILTGAVSLSLAASIYTNISLSDKLESELDKSKSLNIQITELNDKINKYELKLKKSEDNNNYLLEQIEKAGLSPRQIEESDQVTMTMTFYGGGADENGGYAGITAYGESLSDGMVASNVYPKGTKFYCDGKTYVVADKGGSNFNSYSRLDVFVPRYSNETKDEYDSRISNMGRQTVSMLKLPND